MASIQACKSFNKGGLIFSANLLMALRRMTVRFLLVVIMACVFAIDVLAMQNDKP